MPALVHAGIELDDFAFEIEERLLRLRAIAVEQVNDAGLIGDEEAARSHRRARWRLVGQ